MFLYFYVCFVFSGMSGTIVVGDDGVRDSIYMLSMYKDKEANLKPYVSFQISGTNVVSNKF